MSLSHPLPRELTRPVYVGGVRIGGGAPVVVQSMTCTDTADAQATLAQVSRFGASRLRYRARERAHRGRA